MKRRQFGAMLMTTTFTLASVPRLSDAGIGNEETSPLEIEEVSVTIGSVTSTVGSAVLAFDENESTTTFEVSDWIIRDDRQTVSIDTVRTTVEGTDAHTYAHIRSALSEGLKSRSASPLAEVLMTADVSDDSNIHFFSKSATVGGTPLFDQMTATGTVGDIIPENTAKVVRGAPLSKLGTAEFDTVTIQRDSVNVSGEHVVTKPDDNMVSVTADSGTAELPGRTLDLHEIDVTFRPPSSGIPGEHRRGFAGMRRLAANGSLSVSEMSTTLAEAGVTVTNTLEMIGNIQFDMTFGDVTEGGESLISDFRTSGTLAELLPALHGANSSEGTLDKVAIVRHQNSNGIDGPDDYANYVFAVTGGLEKLEPNEDHDFARDQVSQWDGRMRVDGTVGTGDDRFAFSGELIEVNIPAEVQIEVRTR